MKRPVTSTDSLYRLSLVGLLLAAAVLIGLPHSMPSVNAQDDDEAEPTDEERFAQLREQFEEERELPAGERTRTLWDIGRTGVESAARFLLEVAEDSNEPSRIRQYALQSLRLCVLDSMRPRLTEIFRDESLPTSVRGGALQALAGLNRAPADVFDEATRVEDRSLVRDAVRAIARSSLQDRTSRLRELADRFADDDWQPQTTIFLYLARDAHPDTVALIAGFVRRVDDPNTADRRVQTAMRQLSTRRDPASVAEIDAAFAVYEGTGERTRPHVIAFLERIRGGEPLEELFQRATAHADTAMQELAEAISTRLASAVRAVESARGDEQLELALLELIELGPLACNEAFDSIIEHTRSRNDRLQLLALAALGYCTEHREDRQLTSALRRPIRSARRDPEAGAQALLSRARLGFSDIAQQAERMQSAVQENWRARRLLIEALDVSREAEAIDLLIKMLDDEQRVRLRGDIRQALVSLTGQSFPAEPYLWETWWSANRDGFEVPERTSERAQAVAAGGASTSFYGIPVESNRVCFVLDISGSMTAEARYVPSGIPPRDDGEPHDRLDVAKFELIQVLDAVADYERNRQNEDDRSRRSSSVPDGVFSMIFFDHRVFVWRDELQPVTEQTLEEAREYVMEQEPAGATNIYDSLVAAMEIPGVDTIFFMSDGAPNRGEFTEPEDILREIRRRNHSQGIVIHTISIGIRNNFMRQLAAQNGGQNREH